uniref:formin-binding protein 1-like n=1 Tax=Myxine glutinosa TaxID=7769 RepID=UPI00358FE4EB
MALQQLHEGRKAQQHLEACWKQLESCKKRFERDCKEAEKALQYFDKMDNDINVTKADVEKARQQSNQRTQLAEDTKNEYATQLQKYNEEQNQHYFAIMPKIFQDLQDMEEKRTCTFSRSLLNFADIDRQVMPILSKCLDGMTKAAEDINQQSDAAAIVEAHKSGFERPSDVEFEDFSQFISRTHSDSSLSVGKPDGSRTDSKSGLGRSKPKLWLLDAAAIVEAHKSGFERPSDVEFEDFSQFISRTHSDSSLSVGKPDGSRTDSKSGLGRSKPKLWPFGKKHKFMSLWRSPRHPPPLPPHKQPPPFPQPLDEQASPGHQHRELGTWPFDVASATKSKLPSFRSLKRGTMKLSLRLGIIAEDFSHLPPEQRRKKLHQKIDELNLDVKKESDQREALLKMKDVYLRNPQMGDPGSLEPKLQETAQKMEKLQQEVQKFEGWLCDAEGRLPVKADSGKRRSSSFDRNSTVVNNGSGERESSPDGSYTEEGAGEGSTAQRPQPIPSSLKQKPSANPVTNTSIPASKPVPTATLDDDDDFDEDEPLPVLGQCKALYLFEGQSEGTMPMGEDETFQLVEEDKGDGWTRVRRTDGEEGYVPTSYLEVSLSKETAAAGH